MAQVLIGTSGFYYPHWVNNFYPKSLKKDNFFSYYCQYFNTIEINSSFYRLPQTKTVEKWLKKSPPNFIFSFKMTRIVTHLKKLTSNHSLNLFFQALKPLNKSKNRHLILFQLPPFLKVDVKKLNNIFSLLPKKFLYAFEFRHQSWFVDGIYKILKKYNAAVVLSDNPGFWPKIDIETANFFYIRFHNSKKLFSSCYSEKELIFYARLIKEKLKKGLDVYGYFNNDAQGHAVKNAEKLRRLAI